MAKRKIIQTLVVQFSLGFCFAVSANGVTDYYWQKQMLFEPSEQQIAQEQGGQVFVYNGITSADIDLAMDRYYDRIDNMMFVNTVWTNEEGEPIVDPYTGNPVVDDDC